MFKFGKVFEYEYVDDDCGCDETICFANCVMLVTVPGGETRFEAIYFNTHTGVLELVANVEDDALPIRLTLSSCVVVEEEEM